MKPFFTAFLILVCSVAHLCAQVATVSSPDGTIEVVFDNREGELRYFVTKQGQVVLNASKIELIPGAKLKVLGQSVRESDTSWEPTWGQFSTIRDHHVELSLSLLAGDLPVQLQCRVFDTGVGFRFVLSEASQGQKLVFNNEYRLLDEQGYYYPQGERGVGGPTARDKLKGVQIPLVVERADGSSIALIESDLYSASGFGAMRLKYEPKIQAFTAKSTAVSTGAGQVTPWRVLLIDQSVGALALNTVVLNLAAPCQLEDASWVRAGKGLWDWRVHGYDNGDFVYGIDTRSYIRYIDFCAAQGIEYFTVDDHWFTHAEDEKMTVAAEVDIEKVMDYAEAKGVKILLYYDRKKGDFGDDALFGHYSGLGASGMKYGFMGNRADFTRNAIAAAAEKQLLINFHDGPVPMAGVERSMPNLVTREYGHAQQDSRRAFTPETYLKAAMVNALVGPLDLANGNFGIDSINAGERQKGPRIKNSYISTVVSEVARCLITYSGLITLPDAPEEYLKKPDLFEFLKQMPATWDDSRVLHSKIGTYMTVARRSGDTWFVGSVNDRSERTLQLPLDFLDSGRAYRATLYQDAPDAHGGTNSEAYTISQQTVTSSDVITAKMAFGGGHAILLEPIK
jgi:alpha-glucosidase